MDLATQYQSQGHRLVGCVAGEDCASLCSLCWRDFVCVHVAQIPVLSPVSIAWRFAILGKAFKKGLGLHGSDLIEEEKTK